MIYAIKRWFINTFAAKEWFEALEEVKKEAKIIAFRDAQKDILETMEDDIEKKADERAARKLMELLSVVDEKYIMSVDTRTKKLYIGGEEVPAARLANLREEAMALTQFDLWNILHNTPKKLAENALFRDGGDSSTTHTKGRAILYMLDTQKTVIDTLSTQ